MLAIIAAAALDPFACLAAVPKRSNGFFLRR